MRISSIELFWIAIQDGMRDFGGWDLTEADLRFRVLPRVNLRGAGLQRADLYGADLCGANLGDADLRSANLEKANLADAWLGRISPAPRYIRPTSLART